MYCPINSVGLVINYGMLSYLVHEHDWHYLVANLFGAACAAIWNFSLNHVITWRD
jgi:putative flippase GtrA